MSLRPTSLSPKFEIHFGCLTSGLYLSQVPTVYEEEP